MTREQRTWLQEAAEEHEQQIIQSIITARENKPQETMKQLHDAQDRGLIRALIITKKRTQEEWRTQSQNCIMNTERQLLQALITIRNSKQGQGQITPDRRDPTGVPLQTSQKRPKGKRGEEPGTRTTGTDPRGSRPNETM